MRVIVAPDSFGGTLSARAAAAAISAGWARARPRDVIVELPLADGGEGTLDVLAASGGGRLHELEVAGPHGKPVLARWLERDRTAYIETAEAAGLHRIPPARRDPLRTTTYGVGQLLLDACDAGAQRVVVGLGGSATVDGGAGALTALGMRLLREDGNGLKVGGGELHHLRGVRTGWLSRRWEDVEVECWIDVTTPLTEAPSRFGPQKGAARDDVELLEAGLSRFADVLEHDLGAAPSLRDVPGGGAAGGLGYGLAAALGAALVPGAAAVADQLGLAQALAGADLLVTGEGAIDESSLQGKVLGFVRAQAQQAGVPVAAVVGRVRGPLDLDLEVEQAAPAGAGEDPQGEVSAAAARLAARLG